MRRGPTRRHLILLAALYVVISVGLVLWSRTDSLLLEYVLAAIPPLLAFGACWRRARISPPRAQVTWALFAVALFLWCSGMAVAAWDDLRRTSAITVASSYSDLAYYLYGFPILFAIGSPSQAERRSLFNWLDAMQAVMTAILVYVTFFSTLPFIAKHGNPVPLSVVVRAYDIENIFLACAASVRLLSLSGDGERRQFFRILVSFLWLYAISAGLYNHLFIRLQNHMGGWNSLTAIPFLFLTIALLDPPKQEQSCLSYDLLDRPVSLFIENASPVLYTVALFLLAILQIRKHFYLGVATLGLALAIYAARAITMQGRYMRSERSLREAHNWMAAISLQDGLTGIANRRHFDTVLQNEWNRGIRTRQPLSLLLIDIDHFKNLNDTCGHLAGDRCLVEMAARLRDLVPRSGDLLARYGGEEFAIILTSTDSPGAMLLAHRICAAISLVDIAEPGTTPRNITISVGVATVTWPTEKTVPQELIDEADRALYQAKHKGRNRVEVFGMPRGVSTAL